MIYTEISESNFKNLESVKNGDCVLRIIEGSTPTLGVTISTLAFVRDIVGPTTLCIFTSPSYESVDTGEGLQIFLEFVMTDYVERETLTVLKNYESKLRQTGGVLILLIGDEFAKSLEEKPQMKIFQFES